jgi:hypothetical protein
MSTQSRFGLRKLFMGKPNSAVNERPNAVAACPALHHNSTAGRTNKSIKVCVGRCSKLHRSGQKECSRQGWIETLQRNTLLSGLFAKPFFE